MRVPDASVHHCGLRNTQSMGQEARKYPGFHGDV